MLGTKKWVMITIVVLASCLALVLSGLGLVFPMGKSPIRLELIVATVALATGFFVFFVSISEFLKKRNVKMSRDN